MDNTLLMSGISGPGKINLIGSYLAKLDYTLLILLKMSCLGTGKSTLFALSCCTELHTINDWQSWSGKINLTGSYLVTMDYTLLIIGTFWQSWPGKINLIGSYLSIMDYTRYSGRSTYLIGSYLVIMGCTLLIIGCPGQGNSTLLARIL